MLLNIFLGNLFRGQISDYICRLLFFFFFFLNYRLERSLYVKLTVWMSNSLDPDYEPSHLDLQCLQKPNIIANGSERVKLVDGRPQRASSWKPSLSHWNSLVNFFSHYHHTRGKPTSYKTVKKAIIFCEKGLFKSVSYYRFHFVVLTKTRIGSDNVARNKAFIFTNLMHNHMFIVENTRVQWLIRLSKYCAWVFSMMTIR